MVITRFGEYESHGSTERVPSIILNGSNKNAWAWLYAPTPEPQEIKKRTLNQKIVNAAAEIGIENLILIPWKPGTVSTMETRGVIRQAQFGREQRPHQSQDIGYFEAVNKGYSYDHKAPYTVESFIVNPWPFSDEKQDEFLHILCTKGLKPQARACIFGSRITYTKEDHDKWDTRTILYQ